MARIVYGVCGEGFGHSSRAKEIISYLEKKGHKVAVIGYEKSYDILRRYFKTIKIHGLHISFEKNKVDYLQTAINNLQRHKKLYKSFLKVERLFRRFKPDIAFSDFEPLTGLAANLKNIPLISIDNQHRLSNMELEYPKKYKNAAVAAEIIVRSVLMNTKACLVITFFFGKTKNKKTFLFPPIIRKEIINAKPEKRKFILVYQTSETNKKLFELLQQIKENFLIYGFNISRKDKNLVFKKHSAKGFINDLKNCKAVITNGGFSLMTEAIYLHKPVLSEPVAGQFEQIINAVHLEKLGYGKHEDSLTVKKIKSFIKKIPAYEKNLRRYRQNGNEEILRKIDWLIKTYAKI